jgi:hypothetical protein
MPKRPAVLVEAHDDVIVLDLMQNPKFAANDRVRGLLGTVTVHGAAAAGDLQVRDRRIPCTRGTPPVTDTAGSPA